MSLADWLASGADPTRMTPDEIRRLQQLAAVREEQTAARLESLLAERDRLFLRGAATRSAPLRRVFARRWARLDGDVRALERDLARIGKESAGLATLREILREDAPLHAPGDCTPLLTLLDDASAAESEFSARLAAGVADPRPEPRPGPAAAREGGVLDVWAKLDTGKGPSAEEALRRFDER